MVLKISGWFHGESKLCVEPLHYVKGSSHWKWFFALNILARNRHLAERCLRSAFSSKLLLK